MNTVAQKIPTRKITYTYTSQACQIEVLGVPVHVQTDQNGVEHETFPMNTALRLDDLINQALEQSLPFVQLEYTESASKNDMFNILSKKQSVISV